MNKYTDSIPIENTCENRSFYSATALVEVWETFWGLDLKKKWLRFSHPRKIWFSHSRSLSIFQLARWRKRYLIMIRISRDFIKGFRICSGQHSLRLSFYHPKPWFRLARGPSWGSQALRWRISGKLLPSTVVLRGKWYEFHVDTGHHLSLYHWGYMCHRNSLGNSYLHVEGVLSQGYKYIYIYM